MLVASQAASSHWWTDCLNVPLCFASAYFSHLFFFFFFTHIPLKLRLRSGLLSRISLSSCFVSGRLLDTFNECFPSCICILVYSVWINLALSTSNHSTVRVFPICLFPATKKKRKGFTRLCFSSHGSQIFFLQGQALESSCLSRRTWLVRVSSAVSETFSWGINFGDLHLLSSTIVITGGLYRCPQIILVSHRFRDISRRLGSRKEKGVCFVFVYRHEPILFISIESSTTCRRFLSPRSLAQSSQNPFERSPTSEASYASIKGLSQTKSASCAFTRFDFLAIFQPE